MIFNCFSFAQKDKNIVPLKLNLPKNELEPKKIRFEKNEILIDDKKCFNYELFHDVEVNGEQIKNYYEIKSLNGDLLFSGNISNFNPENKFTDTITFYLLENKIYKNSEIVGRGKLVLNLSANQVLNNDCSINLENLKLFYEQSNENK